MRILADSNVFIDFWKKPTEKIIDTFKEEDVVICGVVRSELMHGAKSDADLYRINEMLNTFEELVFEESDWNLLGTQLYKLRTSGITVPFQDAIIALLSVKYNVPVWTNDKHFAYMQSVIPELKLF